MMSRRSIQFSFLALAFVITLTLSFFIFKPYLNVLILAATCAVVFYPLYKGFLSQMPKLPGLAAAITVTLAAIIISTPLLFLGTQVYGEVSHIYTQLNDNTRHEIGPLGDIPPSNNPVIAKLQEKFEVAVTKFSQNVRSIFDIILTNASNFFTSISDVLIEGFLWILAFYYFLRDGHRIHSLLVHFSPLAVKYDEEIFTGLTKSIKSVVIGSLIIAVIQGVLTGVAFAIFNVPNPAIWGLVTIIASLVPTFGTALTVMPAVGYLLLINQTVPALGLFLFWALIIVSVIENIVRPKLMQKSIDLHPPVILLAVLGGIVFFGPIGFLTGPLIVSFLLQLLHVYREMAAHE